MKKKFRFLINSSLGFSLTEVLIAIVILGVAGATIINGMTTDTKVRGKTNTATNLSVNLNAAAEVLLSSNVDLSTCNSTAVDVYSGKISSIPNVFVTKVEALTRETNPTWLSCDSANTSNSAAQRITLQSLNGGTTMQKVILKTSASNANTVATPFSISASKSTMTIAAQGVTSCGAWDTTNLSNSLDSNSIVYFATSADPTKVSSSTSGSSLRVDGVSAGTSTVSVQGINPANGVTSNTITVTATVYPAITFTAPSPQISVVSPNGRQITGSVSITGGSSSTKSVASLDPKLTISNSSYTVDARTITTANTYNYPFTVTDSSLPNASGCTSPNWNIPITVRPKLAFTLNTTTKCIVGTASSCSIPVIITPGTGSGQSVSSGPGNTYAAPNLSLQATSCGAPVTAFKANSLVNLTPSKIQVTLKGSTIFTQFDPSNAKSVNFYMSNATLNNWIIDSLSSSGSGGNILTTLVLSTPSSSTINVTGATPTKIEIAVLNSIYPQLTDSNFSSSYTSASTTLLDQYCN